MLALYLIDALNMQIASKEKKKSRSLNNNNNNINNNNDVLTNEMRVLARVRH